MKKIKKRLVYHFYISPEGIYTYTNKIHFACLRQINNVFDEALFVITIDNLQDSNSIKELELKLISLNIAPNIEFKIKENTYLRDAQTFYEEIALHLKEFDGLTFFAHNKGTTNIKAEQPETRLRTEKWIMSMYFGNFNFIDEMEMAITEEQHLAFGTLLNELTDKECSVTDITCTMGQRNYFYAGAFFWLNTRTISEYLYKKNIEIPLFASRWYAENFFANICPIEYCATHGRLRNMNFFITKYDIQTMIDYQFQDSLEEYNNYCKLIYDTI